MAFIKSCNKILSALTPQDWERWLPNLELVELKAQKLLYPDGGMIDYIYFPVNTVISVQCELEAGCSTEFAQVGNEGLAGIFAFMAGDHACGNSSVMISGPAYRVKADILRGEFNASGAFRRVILNYMQALMQHAAQLTACNRFHSVDQQLARTLLTLLDRIAGDTIALTQEVMVSMLGVRRERITAAAQRLKKAGLIQYSRGVIKVVYREGLEVCACECYERIRSAYENMGPMVYDDNPAMKSNAAFGDGDE
jgi:CRP-like cAMP-binding protein